MHFRDSFVAPLNSYAELGLRLPTWAIVVPPKKIGGSCRSLFSISQFQDTWSVGDEHKSW